jgi:hypothetical protein
MRTVTDFIVITISFIAIGVIIGCEGPQGPPGPQGDPGLGSFAFESFADSIQCATCHTPDVDTTYFVNARKYQWSASLHANGGDLERNGPNCAGCHTTEGFLDRWRNGWTSQIVAEVFNPSPPNCFACHSPHLRGDFTLREADPVTIASFVANAPDAVFNYGAGNQCVQCHQTRTTTPMTPIPDPTKTAVTDTITISTSRWYPHYGVNGQMLMGKGGYEFVDYTYTGSSNHTYNLAIEQNGCASCHMGVQSDDLGTGNAGGHTMKITWVPEGETGGELSYFLAGCQDPGCHGEGIETTDISGPSTGGVGAQTLVRAYVDTLFGLIDARGWFNADTLVNASTSNPLKISPASRAGAIYNYFFIEHEGSMGVHNTKYALELLKSSVAELRKP